MYENIPIELKNTPCWVCYKLVHDEEKNKYDKIPVNPRTGYNSKSNDPSTWSTFDVALKGQEYFGLSGIGFMFSNNDYFGVDVDKCRNKETGELSELAKEVVNTLNSYTEISPSGTGIHVICKGKLPEESGRRNKEGLEMYDSGRFFTVTGQVLDDGHSEVEERTEEVAQLHYHHIKKHDEKATSTTRNITSNNYDHISTKDLIEKACNSRNGIRFKELLNGCWKERYSSQSEADIAFCNMLAFWTSRDSSKMDEIFRNSGLYRSKWDERHGRDTYGNLTIQRAINDCTDVYENHIDNRFNNPSTLCKGTKVESIVTENDEKVTETVKKYSLDDMGNAQRFVDQHGSDIHYSFINNSWYIWNGKYWEVDSTGEIRRRADETIKGLYDEAKNEDDPDRHKAILRHIAKSRSANAKDNLLKEVRHQDGIPILAEKMDSNIRLLNVKNGTIDLVTGKLYPHNRENLITKICPVDYDPNAKCELWKEFLIKIMDGNQELADFLQRAIGYSLTGSTAEQSLFITYGSGANGKSTFLDTIQDLLGDYAKNTSMNTFIAKQNEGISNDIARLVGTRFVSTVEADEGKRLSESLVKQLTGGDKITARFLRQEFFEFTPTFKIWMGTNHKPVIKGTDNGIWRRINLIPFTVTIPKEKQDKNLGKKLKGELPGILNWAIEGCLLWQKEGLKPPAQVLAATEDYRAEMDVVKAFLNECCVKKAEGKIASSTLYNTYKNWCVANGESELNQRIFSLKIKEKNLPSLKSCGVMFWTGIDLSSFGKQVLYGANGKENKEEKYSQ